MGTSIGSPEEPPDAPEEQDESVVQARDAERRRRIAAASKTILTSPQGVVSNAMTGRTILGG